MSSTTVLSLQEKKSKKNKISMLTCYDATFARILAETPVDLLLVGDSSAMVMDGHDSTLPATVAEMARRVAAVRRGAPKHFIVGDMPFLAHRKGLEPAMAAVQDIMTAGASAVKIEGVRGHEALLAHIVDSGVPVMGHLGLTPQSFHQLGGYKVQARAEAAALDLMKQAREVEQAGCFALVLECVPQQVAAHITGELKIPVIGIGAGPHTDGQVLVLQDLLGLNLSFQPKFVRRYMQGAEMVQQAVKAYIHDVNDGQFPAAAESYE